jgi:predicted phage tail protein
MKVRVVAKLDRDWFEFDTKQTKLRSILNHLKQLKGSKYVNKITIGKYKYILHDSTGMFAPIALAESVALQEFNKFDNLFIIEDIVGSGEAIVLAMGSAALTTAATAGTTAALTILGAVVATAINLAISIALQFIIQALSPSPEYNSDPAVSQASRKLSNLFNGVPLVREQGGVCPMVFGEPYCGGVLISVGLFTSETSI